MIAMEGRSQVLIIAAQTSERQGSSSSSTSSSRLVGLMERVLLLEVGIESWMRGVVEGARGAGRCRRGAPFFSERPFVAAGGAGWSWTGSGCGAGFIGTGFSAGTFFRVGAFSPAGALVVDGVGSVFFGRRSGRFSPARRLFPGAFGVFGGAALLGRRLIFPGFSLFPVGRFFVATFSSGFARFPFLFLAFLFAGLLVVIVVDAVAVVVAGVGFGRRVFRRGVDGAAAGAAFVTGAFGRRAFSGRALVSAAFGRRSRSAAAVSFGDGGDGVGSGSGGGGSSGSAGVGNGGVSEGRSVSHVTRGAAGSAGGGSGSGAAAGRGGGAVFGGGPTSGSGRTGCGARRSVGACCGTLGMMMLLMESGAVSGAFGRRATDAARIL